MRRSKLSLSIALALGLAFAAPAAAHDSADGGAIRHLMMATFDKPEAPLTVEPIVVRGDLAVAGWAQGEMGGRALLRRQGDAWQLTLCSGDALKQAAALMHFGLNETEAADMAAAIAKAEADVDPALLAKFSSFDGVVMMDEEGHHPPAHGSDHKPHS
ncbi:MAG: copper uptake system-associated protein [Mesorhizobium sp.]